MKCIKCGAENMDDSKFCFRCGAAMTEQSALGGAQTVNRNRQLPPYNNVAAGNMYYHRPVGQIIPNYDPRFDYKPISMWGYFGYEILFAIPLIGFIFLVVYSLGGTKNINLRNYARSKFCIVIIIILLIILASATPMILLRI